MSGQMRQHAVGDALVVINELAFGDAVIWKEHFVQVGELDCMSADLQFLVRHIAAGFPPLL